MRTPISKRHIGFLYILVLAILFAGRSYAQSFNFKTSEASEILSGTQIKIHGFPDTIIVMCNEWTGITTNAGQWFTDNKLKSLNTFIDFKVGPNDTTAYQKNINYTYHLAYQLLGVTNLSDTSQYLTMPADTLTINYNNATNNVPYQDQHTKMYSGFYKVKVILTGLYIDTGGVVSSANLSDVGMRNFHVEGKIRSQLYNKTLYGSNATFQTSAFNTGNDLLNVSWTNPAGTLTPVSYELEWTYIDNYANPITGSTSQLTTFDFLHNSTRVWLDSNAYSIPLTYPKGYVIFRVRAIRPDSVLFQYPVYGPWSVGDVGRIDTLHITSGSGAANVNCYQVTTPYMGDNLNWQYTVTFAEGGKYKHIGSFYDGLLKNRQSITRFNSNPSDLIVTNNVYDYEGRLSIKSLPAPTPSSTFSYLHDVSLNSVTGTPYKAADFDTGITNVCPANTLISPFAATSLAGKYYSSANPDTSGVQRFVPDALGYPFVQTKYEPAFTDRIQEQGGAGPALQIGSGNSIINSYVGAGQQELNALFGPNVGVSNYYRMTVSQDANQQLSMSIKNYEGKQMVSAMIGTGAIPGSHALQSINVPSPTFYMQNILQASDAQLVDPITATKTADVNYFNEVQATDSLQYSISYMPFRVCDSQYLAVKAHYSYIVTDQCGDTAASKSDTLGQNGMVGDTIVAYTGTQIAFSANKAPYHVHKELSFYPADITASVDSFFNKPPTCLLSPNYFIMTSIDTTQFPCTSSTIGNTDDSDACSKMKAAMIQQLFPGAVYGQYTTWGDSIIGGSNSVFSNIGNSRCYSDATMATVQALSGSGPYLSTGTLIVPDTCISLGINTEFPITVIFNAYLTDTTQPFTVTGQLQGPATGTFTCTISSLHNGTVNGGVHGDPRVGRIYYIHTATQNVYQITLELNYNNTFYNGNIANVTFGAPASFYDIFDTTVTPFQVENINYTLAASYLGPTSYRYRDTCLVSLPSSITVNGVTYNNLRTMPVDSFLMVYNASIAAGNDTIAEALLPLHPEYCEMQNCFNDTFKTQMLAIPDAETAESMGLLYLDSIVAHDPLKGLMTASGLFPNPADSLITYRGGILRLDTMIYTNIYCACSDSAMFVDCYSHLFNYEITNHLLINDHIKDDYFSKVVNTYFANRQKYVDAVLTGNGVCGPCRAARMSLDPTAVIPPAAVAVDTSLVPDTSYGGAPGWLNNISQGDTTGIYDSVSRYLHAQDSLMYVVSIDSVIAQLSNCTVGNPAYITGLRDTFDAMHAAGTIVNGNLTPDQVQYALTTNGITLSDICNPYIINYYNFGTPPPVPVNNCLPATFYSGMITLFNTTQIQHAFESPGTQVIYPLNHGTEIEKAIKVALSVSTTAFAQTSFDAASGVYELYFTAPSSSDTLKFFLHGINAGSSNLFVGGYHPFMWVDCINTIPSLQNGTGLINQYSFVAHFTMPVGGVTTNFQFIGWIDSVQTMFYNDNDIAGCIPCTQIHNMYDHFADMLASYNVYGVDHPYYNQMLTSFMNYYMQRNYRPDQYRTFIQSCALANDRLLPRYIGYATYTFNSDAQMNAFFSALDAVDPLYTFDDIAYRDSAASVIRVSVPLNTVPLLELWKYVNFFNSYSGGYLTHAVNAPMKSVAPETSDEAAFLYVDPAYPFYPPSVSALTPFTLGCTYNTSTRYVWIGNQFLERTFYDITGTIPEFRISLMTAGIPAYIASQGIPGAVFVSNYETAVDADYYKPEKQNYLNYINTLISFPTTDVLDSIQASNLVHSVPTYAGYSASYSLPSSTQGLSNLYISTGAADRHFDTLKKIINLASHGGSSGYIFHDAPRYNAYSDAYSNLVDFHCYDGSYWYRYFTTGDTLFNVYVAFPKYIFPSLRSQYKVVTVTAIPGDSLNRHFALGVVRPPSTDTLTLYGLTSFTIGKDIELDNVLLGQPADGLAAAPVDTFNNCERQLLFSATNAGIVAYNNYMDSVRTAVTAALKQHMVDSSKESLMLGYMTDEFNYTLYNYDRAGNLTTTVTPAGTHPLTGTALLNQVDTARMNNNPSASPAPTYTKYNTYTYNSANQLVEQTMVDGGKTRFFYDAAGRLIFSQNDKQGLTGKYTYNIYDKQNRITETGEAVMGWPAFEPYAVPVLSSGPFPAHYYTYTYEKDSVVSGTTFDKLYWLISPDPPFIQNLNTTPYDSIVSDIRTYNRNDVVLTTYDTIARRLNLIPGLDSQQNLRHRVSCLRFFPYLTPADITLANYTSATHYSYDLDGNVQTITQDIPELDNLHQRYKRIDYDYDVISGKVNMLSYNRSWPDQYYQRYSYDADNRITEVNTSTDGYIWKRDAAYTYYEHGPLARVELGDRSAPVQGIDYAYTIQGWLKAVNGDTLNAAMDMGRDGASGIVAKDAAGFTIDYFKNDYKPITAAQLQHIPLDSLSLYNGNISRQTVAINTFQRLSKQYMYDQLNRINSAAYASVNSANNTLNGLQDYKNSYTYDPDGNITSLVRYGNNKGSGAKLMDSLIYAYALPAQPDALTNLPEYATDNYTNDIQYHPYPSDRRYSYDLIGNLTKDYVSGQDTVTWNMYNKVTGTISAYQGNSMKFAYDGTGNRIAKYVIAANDTGTVYNDDYYVRDAQGNILAIYHKVDVYKASTPQWINFVNSQVRASIGNTAFNNLFVSPSYGSDGYFQSSLIAQSRANKPFAGTEINSIPVSAYITSNTAVRQNLLGYTSDYILPLETYSNSVHDTIIGHAFKQVFTTPNASVAQLLLFGLFSNTDTANTRQILALMCQTGSSSLLNYYSTHLAGPSITTCNASALAKTTVYATYTQSSGNALVNLFIQMQKLFPAQFATYMNLLASSSLIFGNTFYTAPGSGFMVGVRNSLVQYGTPADLGAFFDQYSNGRTQLVQSNDTSALLQVVYNNNMAAYINNATSTLGTSAIDAALASIPNLSYHYYLATVEQVTGVLINPGGNTQQTQLSSNFYLAEHDLYGSSRLGVKNYNPLQVSASVNYVAGTQDTLRLYTRQPWYSLQYQDDINKDSIKLYGNGSKAPWYVQHITGQKQYELADHLGDVITTISDKRMVDSFAASGVTHSLALDSPVVAKRWKPFVISAHDYYPFGEYMPGRYTADTTTSCLLSTVTEMLHTGWYRTPSFVNEYNAGRVTRTSGNGGLSVSGGELHLSGVSNSVVYDMTSLLPGRANTIIFYYRNITGTFQLSIVDDVSGTVLNTATLNTGTATTTLTFSPSGSSATFRLFGSSTLVSGNLYLDSISIPHDTIMAQSVVVNSCSNDFYKYGFNGQMKVNEWAGVGNHNTALFWEYDTRTGRRDNRDPVINPSLSSYSVFNNNPVQNSDHLGNTVDITQAVASDKQNKTNVTGNLTNDLQSETGLNLSTNEKGNLVYQQDEKGNPVLSKDENGNVIGSATARNLLMDAIKSKDVVSLSFNYGHGSDNPSNSNEIALDPVQIMKFQQGSTGVNSKTMGLGLTFLHELGHTNVGGGLSDDVSHFGATGANENRINLIRKELGPDFKQRLSYQARISDNGSLYIPFSQDAFKDLQSNGSTTSGSYIHYTETNRSTRAEDVQKSFQFYKNLIGK